MAVSGVNALMGLIPTGVLNQGAFGALATYGIKSTSNRWGSKFFPATTSPITHVDCRFNKTGTPTHNQTFQIETDFSDAPSGSVLGAATSDFVGPANATWSGAKALGSNTGSLSLNTPYWVTCQYSNGTAPDASNYWAPQQAGTAGISGLQRMNDTLGRFYNGTDWTTVGSVASGLSIVLTHQDGSYTGVAYPSGLVNNGSATDIYGTNRQGVGYKFGSTVILLGWRFQVTKTGSPSALRCYSYNGSTELANGEVAAANVVTNSDWTQILHAQQTIDSGSRIYGVLRQAADGGDDSNDYDLRGTAYQTGYITAGWPASCKSVRGANNNPTLLTEDTLFIPRMFPVIYDPETDLVSAGGGGGRRPLARVLGA